MAVDRSIVTRERGTHRLSRSIRGIPPRFIAQDLPLLGDLNHLKLEEWFGLAADIKPLGNSSGSAVTPQGFRVFGNGIGENDSGFIASSAGPGGVLRATNEDDHLAAVGTRVIWQPDTHGPVRASALVELPSLANLAMFFGFCGTAADAMPPRVEAAGANITLVDDDVAGLFTESSLFVPSAWATGSAYAVGDEVVQSSTYYRCVRAHTAANGNVANGAPNQANATAWVSFTLAAKFYTPNNKSNAAASQTAASVLTDAKVEEDVLALLSVELRPDGGLDWNVAAGNGSWSGSVASALDDDEEHALVLYVEATSAAVRNLNVYALSVDAYVDNS